MLVGQRLIRRPSPATVIAGLALLVALGGTSFAAVSSTLPAGSVGNAQLKNDAVTSNKVKNGTLVKADFRAGTILAGPAGAAGPAGPAGPAGAAGAAGPAGPSDAYSRFLAGPIAVPGSMTTLTSLSIPQGGKYVLWAKAWVSGGGGANVVCQISAGTDSDQVQSVSGTGTNWPLEAMVAHDFGSSGGNADFQCTTAGAGVTANAIRITALHVGNLTTG